jgi:hypothetical protein
VKIAFREAVRDDVFDRKRAAFSNGPVVCPITGETLDFSDAHMDHKAPLTFEVLLHAFLAAKALDYDAVPISPSADNQEFPIIADTALVTEFREYHNRIAILIPITARENISLASKHRIGSTYAKGPERARVRIRVTMAEEVVFEECI